MLALQFATVIISLWAAYKVKEIERMRCFELAALTLLIVRIYFCYILLWLCLTADLPPNIDTSSGLPALCVTHPNQQRL